MGASDAYAIVLLAAGKSSRLGRPKQLLEFGGSSLVKNAALIALQVSNKVIVVLGDQKDKIEREFNGLNLVTCFNNDYEKGIASSIHAGLLMARENFPKIKGVIFIVCDQPFISVAVLNQLIEQSEQKKKGIAACTYAGSFGTPVLFQRAYFSSLLKLQGDHGAKKIIQNNFQDVVTVNFPRGIKDIDTAEDYDALKNSSLDNHVPRL